MLEITILASGSAGNAALVRTESASFLVDAGLSTKELTTRLGACGVEPQDLCAILVTHEHGDHTKGLAQWSKKHATPVYCNRQTAMVLREKVTDFSGWKIFESGGSFDLEGASIRSFPVPHDAVEPVGFVIREGNNSFGFLTDLGPASTGVSNTVTAAAVMCPAPAGANSCRTSLLPRLDAMPARHGNKAEAVAAGLRNS